MKFRYTAAQLDGKIIEGELDAQGTADALQFLAGKGLRPISLEQQKGKFGGKKFFGETVTVADKVFLTRYLSLMLKSGTDLFSAINILINDFDKAALKALLVEIRTNLEKGNPFYSTFANYPRYFSPVFINLIKAGEASGSLSEVLDDLSVSLDQQQELRNKVRAALIYPVILLVLSFLMLLFLVTFAIPKIANVFLGSGFTPPIFSRIVFAVAFFLNAYAVIIFPLIAGGAFGIWYFIARTNAGKDALYFVGTHAPVVNKVMDKLALQRMTSTLSELLKAGLPIIDSLEITADAVGSEKFRLSLQNISREGISKGLTLGEAFRKEAAFPQVVTNLIAISEKAGHTEEILKTLSTFYRSEVDSSIKILVAFIEPILLLAIGVMIGTIALAVIVPIYQLVGTV
ncbi:MAG: type II secretion system F family protein [Patescibacteria group bacterium]|nr:type II secretion system F family protein [Patescibacteria group bacterium]